MKGPRPLSGRWPLRLDSLITGSSLDTSEVCVRVCRCGPVAQAAKVQHTLRLERTEKDYTEAVSTRCL